MSNNEDLGNATSNLFENQCLPYCEICSGVCRLKIERRADSKDDISQVRDVIRAEENEQELVKEKKTMKETRGKVEPIFEADPTEKEDSLRAMSLNDISRPLDKPITTCTKLEVNATKKEPRAVSMNDISQFRDVVIAEENEQELVQEKKTMKKPLQEKGRSFFGWFNKPRKPTDIPDMSSSPQQTVDNSDYRMHTRGKDNNEVTVSIKPLNFLQKTVGKIKTKQHDQPDTYTDASKFYPKKKNKGSKGLMLILNFRETRPGTEIDVENMEQFFGKTLGYEVHDPRSQKDEDFTTEQLDVQLKLIRDVLNNDSNKKYHCFICVILSHGTEKGIDTMDGSKNVEDIRLEFNNQNVPGFVGRPKVFLIQACRGTKLQKATNMDHSDAKPYAKEPGCDESDAIVRVPTDADTLLFFATTPGYKSFRRTGTGSWLITECMRVFEKKYQKKHLEEMLITVRNNVAHSKEWESIPDEHGRYGGHKQMPCVWSTLTRRLML